VGLGRQAGNHTCGRLPKHGGWLTPSNTSSSVGHAPDPSGSYAHPNSRLFSTVLGRRGLRASRRRSGSHTTVRRRLHGAGMIAAQPGNRPRMTCDLQCALAGTHRCGSNQLVAGRGTGLAALFTAFMSWLRSTPQGECSSASRRERGRATRLPPSALFVTHVLLA
jgi:hypothetical protein